MEKLHSTKLEIIYESELSLVQTVCVTVITEKEHCWDGQGQNQAVGTKQGGGRLVDNELEKML
jgi:hypothetical protein